MTRFRCFAAGLVSAASLLYAPHSLHAQANIGGTLRGVITDPTGAAVPTSAVTLTSSDTGTVYQAVANASGEYTFSSIPPGKYALVVIAPGFLQSRFDSVVINLNQTEALPVKLTIGTANTVVEVSTESEKIVTEDTAVTGLFTSNEIASLPLNGRDYQNLAYLSPGVTRAAGGTGQGSGIIAAGTRGTNNNFLVDGVDNNDPVVPSGAAGASSGNIGAVPLDEIAEFTVISSNGSAEFGRSSGAIVNVVTKSGTNQLHGTLFEFVRNPKFNTRQWFDPVGFKSALKQNDFGGRFGLPLLKSKTFASGAYEGYRQRQTYTTTEYYPSLELINTVTQPAFKSLLQQFFPQVSNGGTPITAANYSQTNVGTLSQIRKLNNPLDNDGGFVRFDQNWSGRHQSFLTGSINNIVSSPGNTAAAIYSGYGSTSRPYHFVFGDNLAFGPRVINTFRIGFQRTAYSFPGEVAPAPVLATGASRVNGPYAGLAYDPSVGSPNGIPTVNDLFSLFTTFGVPSNFPQGRAANTAIYSDSINIERGKHQFKFGGELRRIQENGYFSNAVRPSVTISDGSLANFDAASIYTQTQYFYLTGTSNRGFRELEQGYFAEDSWRASDRFTMEFGLRYEIFPPFGESKGLVTNAYLLDSNNNPQPCTSLPMGQSLANLALVNSNRFGLKPFCADMNNFAPRIGFSYDVGGSGKTVIRGGWGEYYDRIFDNVYGNTRFNAPFVATTQLTSGAYDGTEAPSTLSPTTTYTGTIIDPHLRTPYSEHYNFTVSQELTKNTSLTVAYVGGVGRKLFATQNPNFGSSFPDAFRPTNANNVGATGILNPRTAGDIGSGIIRGPFGNLSYRTSNANSAFNSAEVTVKHRLASGFSAQLAYTFAHSMDVISDEIAGATDSASPQSTIDNLLAPYLAPGSPCTNISAATLAAASISSPATYLAAMQCATGNPGLTYSTAASAFLANYVRFRPIGSNYGDSSFDVRHRFAMNAVYELPFGRGKRFGDNVNGALNEVIGGWNLTTTVDTQSGTPYLPIGGVDANRDGTTNDRVILNSYTNRTPHLVKNTALYGYPANGANVSRYQCPTTAPVNQVKTCTDGYNGTVTFSQGIGVIDPTLRMHRGVLREPGLFNWDMEAFKNFHIYRESNLRFSADAFNLLNHANYGVSGATLTSSSFGRSSSQRSINNTYSRQFQFALKYSF